MKKVLVRLRSSNNKDLRFRDIYSSKLKEYKIYTDKIYSVTIRDYENGKFYINFWNPLFEGQLIIHKTDVIIEYITDIRIEKIINLI